MKIKKKFIDNIIHKNGRKILISEVMNKKDFDILKIENPEIFEKEVSKRTKNSK